MRSASESPPDIPDITEVPDMVVTSACAETTELEDTAEDTKSEQLGSSSGNVADDENLVTSTYSEDDFSKMDLEKEQCAQPTDEIAQDLCKNGSQLENAEEGLESDEDDDERSFVNTEEGLESDEDDDERSFVVFNGDLRCEHGTLDYECWVTNERRIVVDEKEWDELVNGIFEPEHFWTVSVDELPCSLCESGYLYKKDDWEGMLRRMKEIRSSIGELIRVAVRRTLPLTQTYERVICRNFLKNMIVRFKSRVRNPTIPSICQECMLCSQHKKPCVLIDSNEGLVSLRINFKTA
ncbi:unnamed protein product [Gongylonema pulchrum]|uniref:Transposon protein, putative, CACTA, En/Spm sub-class n=1 Tax=Gongylonema pulchrum TaxID=637853 RepID=A0A183EF74_9BILA|nr:unnamed protein product [Gongylonema pulchrum]